MNKEVEKDWYKHMVMEPVRVMSQTEISSGVFLTGFEKMHDFIPGQVVLVTTDPAIPGRMYSIASGRGDKEIKILYNINPGGELTPKMADLKPGDQLRVSAPFGTFTGAENKAFWIATGTGIAPFLSMVFSGLIKGKTLIHGSRTSEGFYFSDKLTDIFKERYIRCCSGKNDKEAYAGRVTDYLRETKLDTVDCFYYLCGSAEMVVDVRQILLDKGVPMRNILAEIYF